MRLPNPMPDPADDELAPPPLSAGDPEDAELKLGEVLDFMRVLWAVDHGLQAMSKRMESTYGITGPQRVVVRIVGRFPGISAGRLAEILHMHPSTLSGILKRLETRGVLVRERDPKDARRALFGLSREGRKIDQSQAGTVEAAARRVVAAMSADVEVTKRVLLRLADELEQERQG